VSEAEEASLDVLSRHTVAEALEEFEKNGKRVGCETSQSDDVAKSN